jgi:hypothetical protein
MPPPSIGIKLLYLDDGNDLIESTRSFSGATEPVSCDKGRFIALLGDWPGAGGGASPLPAVRYRVPDDPPPVIEICAYAEGFDGRKAQTCGNFYTGDVWEGTIDSTVTSVPASPGPCGTQTHVEGEIRLLVAGDGTVTGTYDVAGCLVSEPHAEFTGTATDDGFTFPDLIVQTNGQPVPKVSPTEAQATLNNFQGAGGVGAQWSTVWKLTCKSC